MTLNKFLSCPRFFLLPSVRTGEFLRSTEPSSNRVIAGEKSSVLSESFHGHQLSSLPPRQILQDERCYLHFRPRAFSRVLWNIASVDTAYCGL